MTTITTKVTARDTNYGVALVKLRSRLVDDFGSHDVVSVNAAESTTRGQRAWIATAVVRKAVEW